MKALFHRASIEGFVISLIAVAVVVIAIASCFYDTGVDVNTLVGVLIGTLATWLRLKPEAEIKE